MIGKGKWLSRVIVVNEASNVRARASDAVEDKREESNLCLHQVQS